MNRRTQATALTDEVEPEPGHDQVSIEALRPSPENEKLYRPVLAEDPDVQALAESIRQHGIREPLVVTLDNYILSGHRRLVAARLSGLAAVPCRVEPISRTEQPERFLVLLREHNRQREKSLDEKLREVVVDCNRDVAHAELLEYRRARAKVKIKGMSIVGCARRHAISKAKRPFLDGVLAVVQSLEEFWPLSDRQIHYSLLNNPPRIHSSKADSVYTNDKRSYHALTDLLTRARLEGTIPWAAISDVTRPVTMWDVHRDCGAYLAGQMDGFLRGYFRNLMQSQPNHIEIVAEKLTVATIVNSVAADFCIPVTIGRGYCSLQPRYAMAERFKKSGKDRLVVILVSDFDPDGEEIAQSFARSLRDDFEIKEIKPVKAVLTAAQVKRFRLPPMMQAKETSANHRKFTVAHGKNVFELEALPPARLQMVLREAIESVVDCEALEIERQKEKQDAEFLENTRRRVLAVVGDVGEGGQDQ
ncbi:MAG: ParB N-terminal domain-containing protein [Deltaproteobacteria bacterium]|nr:ParB N-terminal domain-containing protein [Deltaproteobacteria bacterium]